MILGIYCAGGLGREVLALARRVSRWKQIVFIDDYCEENAVQQAPVLTFEKFCRLQSRDRLCAVIATGEAKTVQTLYGKIADAGIRMETIVDPSVEVPEDSRVGNGVVIQKGVIISANCVLEDCSYLNYGVIIGHDVQIKRFSNVSFGSLISGFACIGEATYIGAGVTIRDEVTIGKNTIIGMGSVVTTDIPDNVVAYGNPCKVVRENLGERVFR